MKLPNSWTKEPLHKVLLTLKDGTHFSPKSTSGAFKYITSKNIKFGTMDLSDISYISEEEHRKIFKASPVQYGDVLLTKDGANTGNAALNVLAEEFSLLSSVAILSGKKNILVNNFLIQILLSPMGQSLIKSQMAGQAITRLTLKKIGELVFPIPPLPEQKKIAKILSTWDKAITTTEQLLANSKQQKKALMQQLLTGKKRLPGFSGQWCKRLISEFIIESRTPGNTGDIAKKITIKLYGQGVIQKKETRSGSESTKYYIRKSGQFIYSKLDFLNGAFGIIPENLDGYESTLDLPAFNFLPEVCPKWFLYFVSREEFYKANLGLANGGRKARRVNPKELLELKVHSPSLKEQQKIATILSTADKEIETLQQKLDCLKQEKKALMQQLLTGKRRVNVDELEVA
ncbi:restriction endonuclease subunit S [Endozoicomonas sp. SM1973]|uniref:Restriction endonuclease subunit S n=1 Tax=Spartinivicinus marinus TaxID=2994442 RepID=A0A853HXD4_9GAMM|nr:restriction endonuclease subunit S [Spartinivicinus marinus]MCX4027418.1 restriction endonuclease subunit S [Spartinivicinus marinus]NYZ66410.1 restriction endonuclease subunit S [Spartinivicinus marinus]